MYRNIAQSLSEVADKKGRDVGIIEAKSGKALTFDEIERRSDQYAWHFYNKGVMPGDRVMLMVKPSIEFICITFALFKLGAPVILIDPGMGYKNLLTCIAGVEPKVFIGIPKAHLFLKVFKNKFLSVEKKFCIGKSYGLFGPDTRKTIETTEERFPVFIPGDNDLAAIIFTTGSTGPPKGVRYEHSIFAAQLKLIKYHYKISQHDIDQPAFPLFALFSAAIGACSIIPNMDATKPARVNPGVFIQSIKKHKVSYSFGSPALWNVVSDFCIRENITLNSLKKVLMAGAPVSGELIEKVYRILPDTSEIHIPYGATESLPIVSIEGREIINNTWEQTQRGKGTCVGMPLPGIEIGIISIKDGPIEDLDTIKMLGPNEIGEIIVSGDVVTKSYDNNEIETKRAKISGEKIFYHRMGDTGYIDDTGKLWFCGRKAHRVLTENSIKYSVQCEAIINQHPQVFRSALVGIDAKKLKETPVIIIELKKDCKIKKEIILEEIRKIALKSDLTKDIDIFLFHKSFPVDIRHNAKIFREKLSAWAEKQVVH